MAKVLWHQSSALRLPIRKGERMDLFADLLPPLPLPRSRAVKPMPSPTRNASGSYVVPCPSSFRRRVLEIAIANRTSPQALVRNAIALVGPQGHPDIPDPGEPRSNEVDLVPVRSADGVTRMFRRKPVLRMKLQPGLDAAAIRRLLAVAVALHEPARHRILPATALDAAKRTEDRVAALEQALKLLAFRPFQDGVKTPRQAAYVMGFLNEYGLDRDVVAARFRHLAPLFHPDTGLVPDGDRLRQLVDARNMLLRGLEK